MLSSQPSNAALRSHLRSDDGLISDGDVIIQLARELFQRHARNVPALLLKDRNVALVCEDDGAAANIFCQAARQLGARVSRIRPSLTEHSDPGEIQHTARLLGRLYSALEWPHLSPRLREQLKSEAGIPVYAGISLLGQPVADLAEQLDVAASPEDKRRLVVQAVLLRDLG